MVPEGTHCVQAYRLLPLLITAMKYTYSAGYSMAFLTRRAMKRVLCTILMCALGPAQASAQNHTSQQLLELEEEQRNAAFSHMLWDSERKCDQVIRTLFNGTVLGVDDWRCFAATDVLIPLASL